MKWRSSFFTIGRYCLLGMGMIVLFFSYLYYVGIELNVMPPREPGPHEFSLKSCWDITIPFWSRKWEKWERYADRKGVPFVGILTTNRRGFERMFPENRFPRRNVVISPGEEPQEACAQILPQWYVSAFIDDQKKYRGMDFSVTAEGFPEEQEQFLEKSLLKSAFPWLARPRETHELIIVDADSKTPAKMKLLAIVESQSDDPEKVTIWLYWRFMEHYGL